MVNFLISNKIQIISSIVSILFFVFVVNLVRKQRIKEEYSLLWIFFAIIFIVLSVWKDGIIVIGNLVGIAYSPTALILILIMAIITILIQFSMVISKLTEKNKILIQEIGLLKFELEKLKKKIEKNN